MTSKCKCSNCGKRYTGWALKYAMEQAGFVKCGECGSDITKFFTKKVLKKVRNRINNRITFTIGDFEEFYRWN